MRTISKLEFNELLDTKELELVMYDTCMYDNKYYKIKCIANEVHLLETTKPEVEVGQYEITNERFKR